MYTTVPFLAILAFFSEIALSQKCIGQSCYVAHLSGSTETPYTMQGGKKPTGGNAMGDNCIKNWYKKNNMPAPAGLKRYGVSAEDDLEAYNDLVSDSAPAIARRTLRGELGYTPAPVPETESTEVDVIEKRAECKPWVLLYGRGTTEAGELGMTVGPSLAAGLRGDPKWLVKGLGSREGYNADLSGIYCIGMPGGMACKDILNKMAAECPNTKFVTSGYSQGAMVARICVGYANEAAKKQVAGMLTFGDPFNGATVKGFPQDKIKVFCNPTDGVCKGDFSIGAGHLSYSTAGGVAWLKQLSGGR